MAQRRTEIPFDGKYRFVYIETNHISIIEVYDGDRLINTRVPFGYETDLVVAYEKLNGFAKQAGIMTSGV